MTNPRELEHTLKNQLGIILGFVELLLDESAPDDPRRCDIEEIHKAATTALEVVSALGASEAPPPAVAPHPDGLDAMEREHIVRVLGEVQGNKLAAAKRLGISRRTLYRRLERHGLGPG